MKIKGQDYTFSNLSGNTLNEKIERLQQDLKNCARKISLFDVYRIRYVVEEISDYNAILNRLLPGESLIVQAQGDPNHPAGEVTVRTSNTDYETIEPFQTGSYYPSGFERIYEDSVATPNYKITYSFVDYIPETTDTPQLIGADTSNIYDKYYGVIEVPNDADVYYQLDNGTDETSFAQEITSSVSFDKKDSKPIVKFFLKDDNAYEEIIVPFTLTLNSTTQKYTIALTETAPSNLYVAVK